MYKEILISLVLACLPAFGWACVPARMPTDSVEPVTIKIADTYFQIPEGYLTYPFQRAPMEREYIQFNVPVHILTKERADSDQKFGIQIHAKGVDGRGREQISLNGTIVGFSHGNEQMTDSVAEYIRSISSQTEPPTWKEDIALASAFGLGKDPCGEGLGNLAVRILKNSSISYDEIKAGLNHRNEAIRAAAAAKAGEVSGDRQAEALAKLKEIIKRDPSGNVRAAATTGIAKMAETDSLLLPLIIKVMLTDKNEWVQRNVSYRLNKFSAAAVMPYMPAIETLNETHYKDIGNVLVWVVNHEVSEKKLTSPDQLSVDSLKALKDVTAILERTSDEETIEDILNSLNNSKSAVATPELIAVLNNIVVSGKGKAVSHASTLLSAMGVENTADSIPLIIKRMKESNDPVELSGLIRSFQNFGDKGKEAVPIIIEYTRYNLENENPSVVMHGRHAQPWIVRLAAVTTLQFMHIKTPEVKAALEVAQNDHNGMVKSQATAALKEF